VSNIIANGSIKLLAPDMTGLYPYC